jgi:uncharacterized protein (TIGR02265 family)
MEVPLAEIRESENCDPDWGVASRPVPSSTNHSMFEALFDRRLKPAGAFAAALKDAGYDPRLAVPKYSTHVWVRCLEIARAHRYATLPATEAYREIGREFTLGFLETLPGRLLATAIPFMTPRSFLRRLASYLRMGREDERLTFDLVKEEATAAEAVVHNPAAVPGGFVAGMIDVAMERLRTKATVEVDQHTPLDYTLRVRWS